MLKNVAIPLMLAASEAEAQPPSNKQILDAIRADRERDVPELIADQAACTVTSSQTADGIAAAATKVTNKEAALVTAKGAVDTLTNATGAWTLANTAREAAVTAATASEAEAGIAAKLDAVDAAAGDERVKAAAYVAADKLYQAGLVAQTDAGARVSTAATTLSNLSTAKDNAATAVSAVRAQITKEKLWREWLYCELGASVTGAAKSEASTPSNNWWSYNASSTIANAVSAPATCVVPAVRNAADDADLRAAVTYYSTKAGITSEADDGSTKWNATVDLTEATTAESASSNRFSVDPAMTTMSRQEAGVVAWRTGALRKATYIWQQRTRETAMYTHIANSASTAKTAVDAWVNASATDLTAATTHGYGFGSACTVISGSPVSANCKSSAKLLAEAKTARDAGSDLAVASDRTAANPATPIDTWAATAASVGAWKTSNTASGVTANASYTWWLEAQALSVALDAWYTAMGGSGKPNSLSKALTGTPVAALSTDIEEAEQQTVGNTSARCASAATPAWTAATSGTDAAACKLACITVTVDSLIVDAGYTDGSAKTNGNTAKYLAAGEYCGAYSFDAAAQGASPGSGCFILKDSETAAAQADGGGYTAIAADRCFVMKKASGTSHSSKQWYDWATAVKTAWDTVKTGEATGATPPTASTKHIAMATAMGVQADLENAWLAAYYDEKYWTAVQDQVTVKTSGTNPYYTGYTTPKDQLAKLTTDSGVTAADCLAVALADKQAADSNLTTAQATLTTLQAATATAQAAVDELGRRILRADAELAELKLLSDATTPGTLDEAAAKRLATYNAFASDGENVLFVCSTATGTATCPKGESVLATEAKAAADLAVRAEVGTAPVAPAVDASYVAPGVLTLARSTAQSAWTAAIGVTAAKKLELSTALGTASLETLRAKVASDTLAWNSRQFDLDGLVDAVTAAEGALDVAKAAQADLVIACQVAAYDTYRETLELAMIQRNKDLVAIKDLIVTELTRKPAGTIGSRCEKALSNGTMRPNRSGEVTCGSEDNCCGAARVWMAAGPGTADAMWRTIETCQNAKDTTFSYVAARAPLAVQAPAAQSVPFTCIEGAKKLAAAASAVAAAVYMLA